MCTQTIVKAGLRFGTYSFTTGIVFKREPTLMEWAKTDFDACFNYLLGQGMENTAEELFWYLVRVTTVRSH